MIPKLPGSGNHLVDARGREEDLPEALPCGCDNRCQCDDDDEEGL